MCKFSQLHIFWDKLFRNSNFLNTKHFSIWTINNHTKYLNYTKFLWKPLNLKSKLVHIGCHSPEFYTAANWKPLGLCVPGKVKSTGDSPIFPSWAIMIMKSWPKISLIRVVCSKFSHVMLLRILVVVDGRPVLILRFNYFETLSFGLK